MTTTARPFTTNTPLVEDPTVGFRRRISAVALPFAFLLQLACNTIYAWVSTTSGMTDTESATEALEMFAAFPGEALAATLLAMTGCMLALLGLPTALRVFRPVRPRMALWAVGLMMVGYLCYFGISFAGFDTIALAVGGVDAGTALDNSPVDSWSLVFFLLFVIGNLFGTLLLGLTVLLAGHRVGVPRWAGALIACWTVGHILNIVLTNEWFAVAGGALQLVGLILLALAALRLTNHDWVLRG